MKAFNIFYLISIISMGCSLGCTQESNKVVGLPKYAGCCGTQPKVYTLLGNSVYVPNVFTPNGDGINDYFMPTLRVSSDSLITRLVCVTEAVADMHILNFSNQKS